MRSSSCKSVLLALLSCLISLSAWSEEDYRIGGGDLIEIMVFEEEDLTRTLRVSSDGYINFPLVGKVKVADMTAIEISELLMELLGKDYLINPHVTVNVKEYNSKKVQVLGAVKQPGVYTLTGRSNILEILARAGGVEPEGGKAFYLLRGEGKKGTIPEKIDLHALLTEGDTNLNREVSAGDIIFIPKASEVYVTGEVKEPGSITYDEGMTLVKAVSKAGGFSKSAQTSKIHVLRMEDGKEIQVNVNAKKISQGKEKDFPLQPGDVIVVSESLF